MSLKLEEIPFKFEGKTYQLRCNMAVLEEVQEENGGDLFETIGKAIEHVCKSLCFEYVPKNWDWDDCNKQFYSDFVVNNDNEELTEKYDKGMLDGWRKGEFNLWDCRVTVDLIKCTDGDIEEKDFEQWRKEKKE